MKQNFKNYFKKYYIVYIIIALTVTLDLVSKVIFSNVNKTIIKNVLTFTSTKNTGGAFSLLSSHTILLVVFSVLFLVVIVVIDKFYKNNSKLYLTAYSLILSGAIGNLVDRVLFGYVRDFIKLDFLDFTNFNTVFNFADMCITVGVAIMIVHLLISIFKEKKQNDKNTNL